MNLLFFLLVASFWGGSFIAIKPLVAAMPALMAGAIRIGVAIVSLTIVLPSIRIPLGVPKNLRARVWGTGVMGFGLPFALLFWGEQSITPGLAGILNGTVPLWVYVLGMIFTPKAEAVTARKTLGLLCGIGGVLLIFLPRILNSGSDNSLIGALAVAGMAVSYGTSVLLNRTIFVQNPQLHPFSNLFQQLLSGFVTLLTISLIFEGLPNPTTWQPVQTVVGAELYLGCISTTMAFMMFYRLIKEWGSVRASTVTYVVPAAALLLDLLFNHHLPQINEAFGVIAVTVGVIILNVPPNMLKNLLRRAG